MICFFQGLKEALLIAIFLFVFEFVRISKHMTCLQVSFSVATYKTIPSISYISLIREVKEVPPNHLVSAKKVNNTISLNEVSLTRYYHNNDDMNYLTDCKDCENYLHNLTINPMIGTIFNIKDIYVNSACSVITTEREYINLERDPVYWYIHRRDPGYVVGAYNSVIAFGHDFTGNFGHWICDVLCPLTFLPEDVVSTSYFIVKKVGDFMEESLCAFNVPKDHIIPVGNEWVYACRAYLIAFPTAHLKYFGQCAVRLSKRLREYYNVSNVIPTKYIMFNRGKNVARHIANFDVLVEAVNKKYGKNKFEVMEDKQTCFKNASKIWSVVKLVFMLPGSNSLNFFFMKEKSVLVIGSNDIQTQEVFRAAAALKLDAITFINTKGSHSKKVPFDVDVNVFLKSLNIGMIRAKTGKWPKKEAFYNCADVNKCV